MWAALQELRGDLNRIQSSRRLEREAQRNVELMWLTERLTPDHKTIANFRKENGKAIRGVCRQFVVLCQRLGLPSSTVRGQKQRFSEGAPRSHAGFQSFFVKVL